MKYLAALIFVCATCMAQDAVSLQGCPLKLAVAGTNVPLQNGEHIVVWFENRSGKTVSGAQFELAMIDGAGRRHPARQEYSAESAVKPDQAGLMMEPASNEARQFSDWRSVRGLDVRLTQVVFADGARWHSSDSTSCRQTFKNANYQHDMREWNASLRADWNRRHPNDPMPGPALAAWLLPHSGGWQ